MLNLGVKEKHHYKKTIIKVPTNHQGTLQSPFSYDVDRLVFEYINKEGNEIEAEGFIKALELFHQTADRVPAYKDFLKKNKINHHKISSLEDFKQVPIVSKHNYLRVYPFQSLCWDGKLNDLYILSSSSGSTGEPFLWPRGDEQELEGALQFELIFKNVFQANQYKTLYILCFAMGTWISGTFCLSCARQLTSKGYPILTVTPGLDRDVTFVLFKNLANNFDQIVFSGYPPYIKDILDAGKDFGINWKKYKMRFLFAAEGFSERWRDYIHNQTGSKSPLCTSINIYGSADAAILANETPLTTAIRRLVNNHQEQMNYLFNDSRLPTLAQYDPRLKYMEEVDRKVIFTTRSGLPLIRYDIGDTGGVYSYDLMKAKMSEMGYDLATIMQRVGQEKFLWKLPFVYVFGRSDFTVSLYGLLIYPEHIKVGLERKPVSKYVTGKFLMSVEFDDNLDQYLLIRVELAKHIKSSKSLAARIQKSVVAGLLRVNSEFRRLKESIDGKALPVIDLVENGNADCFKLGIKQRWVKKA